MKEKPKKPEDFFEAVIRFAKKDQDKSYKTFFPKGGRDLIKEVFGDLKTPPNQS